MAKNDNAIYWIIGIVVFFLVVTQTNIFKEQETGMIGLNVHYYKDGIEVFPTKGFLGFSIVTPPGESYNQISLDVIAQNIGDVPFSDVKVYTATPTAFLSSLGYPTTPQSLNIGESKTLWTSDLMDTVQFESMTQPVNFIVAISAVNDYTGETVYVNSNLVDLTIEAEDPPPIITVIVPEQGGEYFSPITFEIYINEIAEAQISIDSGPRLTMDYQGGASATPPNLKFVYTATLSGGSYSVTFYATDTGANTAEKSVDFEICISHSTYSCYGGDVYWYDSCGNREEKKEECGTLICTGGACVFSSFYQETANSYSFTDDWMGSSYCAFDWNKFKDGSWTTSLSTATKSDACAGQATMIYQKPNGAASAIWKVKDERGTVNLNIPSSCWSASPTELTIRYRSRYGSANYIIWECYEGGAGYEGYTTLRYEEGIGYPTAYEEAVTWN